MHVKYRIALITLITKLRETQLRLKYLGNRGHFLAWVIQKNDFSSLAYFVCVYVEADTG